MAMKLTKLKAILLAAILASAATSVAGCNADTGANPDFFPPSEASAEKKLMDAQASVGARSDASLYTAHFDGTAINSLGKAKLDLIADSLPDQGPLTLYIDLPKDAAETSARVDAVKDYLINSHLTEDQFKLVIGTNPNAYSPSASALTNMPKTETSAGSGGSSGSSSGSSSSSTSTK